MLMDQWLSTALSSSKQRILGILGEEDSWGLMYNLYADVLLGTNLVPKSVSVYCTYHTALPTLHQVLDIHTNYLGTRLASREWPLMTAAISTTLT